MFRRSGREIGLTPRDFDISALETIADLTNKSCREVYHYWTELDATVPFNVEQLLDLPSHLPIICLVDRVANEDDFIFKFVGQKIVTVTKRDLTGTRVLAGQSKAVLTKGFCRYFLSHEGPAISSNAFTVTQNGIEHRFEEAIGLPLRGERGMGDRYLIVHGMQD